MSNFLKILPLFLLTALLVAGCDFGKSPDMDKVRDVLMEEYGEEVYGEEAFADEEAVGETKGGPFAFDSECNDEGCQQGFRDYMVIAWGEDWETECEEEDKVAEYEFYLVLREELGLGGGG